MTDVRIGVQLQPQHAGEYGLIRDAVLRAEEAGVDVVFNWDHFYPLTGDPEGYHYECWTMLGAWAEQTERVQIGALVTGGGYRNPDLLADMARTVDHISGGRLILGVGAGWNERDYTEYQYEFGTPGTRLALLKDYLPRIVSRLDRLHPRAVGDLPVLVGGGGERKTLRLVAEHANIWHGFGDLETFTHKSGVLEQHCADVGRDPATIARSTAWPGVDQAEKFVEVGASLFTIGTSGPEYNLDEVRAALAWRDARG
ncbi:LLM class F420-dependent oxidoreductase [Ruania halotolerans]|uniref:LLM class F420-dependent oxidoreductase n=1 Tax=Ruania halotolerans TaxID=2897773 RepID=UPI001E4FAFCB|nr:LLM class F420-dependent oxidoreductase [Ruania halotolerans]UFU05817.1 LLM class F420-dependent oxidoreductase [Ruania halotolerans]